MSESARSRRRLTKADAEKQEQARREALARERIEAMEIALLRVLNDVAEMLARWRSESAESDQAAPPVYIKDEEDAWEAWADDYEAEQFYPRWGQS
jgi:hypothetical protein